MDDLSGAKLGDRMNLSDGTNLKNEPILRDGTMSDRLKPCPLFAHRDACTNIVLPAPIPVSEAAAFGVAAPTTSTTVAMALGDALALAAASQLHARPSDVFRRNHPGGTIGLKG